MTIAHFIDNEDVSSKTNYVVKSASTKEEIHAVSSANDHIIEEAISAAARALKTWRKSTIQARQQIFLKAADLMEEQAQDFVDLMQRETPCASGFSDFNRNAVPGIFRDLASSISFASRGEIIPIDETTQAMMYREPFGVCLAMAPWNAPLILACRAFATPIVAGNTVVFKTSELSPATHARFGRLMGDAGLPAGVLNIVHVDAKDAPKYAERMISDARIRHVNFTGSTRVGSIIGALAGKYLKPAVLELGGKAPAIVLEDADLGVAASHCLLGAWMHQGQICMSTEKVIVLSSIYDAFIEKLRDIAESSQIKDSPLGQAIPSSGPKVRDLIAEAIAQGARPLMQQSSVEPRDDFISPNILVNVTKDMRIYSEETFAPVFIVMPAESEEAAIELANDTEYGLSSAVFSHDTAHAVAIGRQIEAGATHINSMTVSDHPNVPHGGNKASGFGRFNGVEGIRSFTQTKVITLQGQGHDLSAGL